ncbi:hypothetical protein HDU79_011194 [Rhizoclosmatium sp. JEL0117]|nr:hypothetical protein HDU79_011194 [Rhizoclosmatium sp. JEL0117]
MNLTVITMKSAIFLLAAASLGFCQNVSGVNGSCGGFVLNPNVCATGLVCVRRTNLPDVGGTCQYPTTADATADVTADVTADATGVVGTIDVATDTQAVVATVDATTTAPAAAATSATTSSAAAKASSTATSTTKAASFGTSASLSMAAAMITFLMA